MTQKPDIAEAFRHGFRKAGRTHQVSAASRPIDAIAAAPADAPPKFLLQHTAGSGKTEVVLLVATIALEMQLVDHCVILKY